MCSASNNLRSATEFPTDGERFITIGRSRDAFVIYFERIVLSIRRRVAFVCPAGINYYKNSHLRVAFVCGSGAIVWPYVGIVLASPVHWLLTKFGAIFAGNSKFHIRMAIWCQFRNSVTPASGKEIPECDSESIEINDIIDLLPKVLKSLEDVGQKDY